MGQGKMSKNPKIVVFKLKELIYTGIFILLGILLIILFVWMFKSGKSKDTTTSNTPTNNTAKSSVNATSDNSVNTSLTTDNSADKASKDNADFNTSSNDNAATDNTTSDNSNAENTTTDNSTDNNSSDSSNNSSDNSNDNQYNNSGNGNSKTTKTSDKKYLPGVYTSSLMLNNSALEIEVCVDFNKIKSAAIKNMDDAISTMYPLIENAMKDLEHQIVSSNSLDNITYTDDCKYTYLILLDAVKQALSKAEAK